MQADQLPWVLWGLQTTLHMNLDGTPAYIMFNHVEGSLASDYCAVLVRLAEQIIDVEVTNCMMQSIARKSKNFVQRLKWHSR